MCRLKESVQFNLGEEFQRSGHFADGRLLIPMKECGVIKESWKIVFN